MSSHGAPDSELVIPATKLHAPATRPDSVPRTALLSGLIGDAAKLTLIGAPAGFGKTTLLADWRASPAERRPFAWVSIDAGDNDPRRFWGCVIAALRTLQPALGAASESVLANAGAALEEVALPLLVNDLAALPEPIVLVLDDYHVVREERVHESLGFLVERMPATLHLVVATRSDPPLPLARLRARGDLAEVRATQLRLSDAEAAALLRAALGAELDAADVATLQQRTEGWPAGLYLAALSLRDRPDARAFIASFAGDDRHVVDYLVSEVLAGEPRRRARVPAAHVDPRALLRAALRRGHRRSGRRRAARADRAPQPVPRPARQHAAVVPLPPPVRRPAAAGAPADRARRRRPSCTGARTTGTATRAPCPRRSITRPPRAATTTCASWSRRTGTASSTRAGSRPSRAGSTRSRRPPSPATRGSASRARGSRSTRGRLDAAHGWIEAASAGGAARDAAVLRAVHEFKTGDAGAAIAAAREVLGGGGGDAFALTVAHLIEGASLHWRGEEAAAAAALGAAAGLAADSGNALGQGYALGYLALAAAAAGDPDEAERLATDALGLRDDAGFREHFAAAIGPSGAGHARAAARRARARPTSSCVARSSCRAAAPGGWSSPPRGCCAARPGSCSATTTAPAG